MQPKPVDYSLRVRAAASTELASNGYCRSQIFVGDLTLSSFHEKADPCSLHEFFSCFSRSTKPPLSPPFHPHSSVSNVRLVQVGCSRFSRRCYLISVLCFSLYEGSWART
jgi:hypothetical protein